MIGIDTNVLVRYITQDNPKQSSLANRYIESLRDKENFIFINHIVLCELVWVLRRCYNINKPTLLQTIEQILKTVQFRVDSPHIVLRALKDFKTGQADFADYLVGRINMFHDCTQTITFDTKAGKSRHFCLLNDE